MQTPSTTPRLAARSLGALAAAALLAACERPTPSCPVETPDSGVPTTDAADDAAPARPARVLVYSRTTGFRHDSIPAAVAALRAALPAAGIEAEATEDLAAIEPAALARFGAIVLVSTTGEPFGPDDSPQVSALLAFVRGGGGLVGLHSVADAYPCGRFPTLIGGTFRSHPGDTRRARCFREGTHPAVAALPEPYELTDEIHVLYNFRGDNQVALRCESVDGRERVPIAWWRAEGHGRMFVTLLGHPRELWSDARFLGDHVVPAVRWALGR